MKTAIVWLRNDLRFQDQESFIRHVMILIG